MRRIIAFLIGMLVPYGVFSMENTPQRVVSINLCTDQLAMMLAQPTQLFAVSHVAFDPLVSPMAIEAQNYELNYGFAEEIYMMQPDLVFASEYSNPALLNMLKRLGIKVEAFAPSQSFSDVKARIAQMGAALAQEDTAAQLIADFDAQLDDLNTRPSTQVSAMIYAANGYTSGQNTLAHEILEAARYHNAALEAGYAWGGKVPLEILAINRPDVLITSSRYPAHSQAEAILAHPIIKALQSDTHQQQHLQDQDWVCGTPYVLRAAKNIMLGAYDDN